MVQHDYSEYPHYAGTITIKYEKQTKMKKYYYNVDNNTCTERCMVKNNGVNIGSGMCITCENCKGYSGGWIKCSKINLAINKTKMKTLKLNEKDLKKAYNEGCPEVKQTLKNLYPNVSFERKLPKTWEEYCNITKMNFIGFELQLHYLESLESCGSQMICKYTDNGMKIDNKFEAMWKLELLRDFYNDGWVPNWVDNSVNRVILRYENNIKIADYCYGNVFLSFKTSELRGKFLTNFKDLIEQAKDLI